MRLLLVIDNLTTGGITTSLYNFLQSINPEKVECDLLVFDRDSINYNKIPSYIRVIDGADRLCILGVSREKIRMKSIFKALSRACLVLVSKLFSGNIARNILFMGMQLKEQKYDLAIAYCHDLSRKALTPGGRQFVSDCVSAKKKAVYIHCDYNNYGGYSKKQIIDYEKMDVALCVSEGCKCSFLDCFPDISIPVLVQENFADVNTILKKANEYQIEKDKRLTFTSVCRLSEEKGIHRCVGVIAKLQKKYGDCFKWIIVGDGPNRGCIEEDILRYGLDHNIEMVGQKDNPYPYFTVADYFLLPSIHEAAPMVYAEAAVLGVPVLTTQTTSAKELVESKHIGFVCDNSEEGLLDLLEKAITNKLNFNFEILKNYDPNINARRQLENLVSTIDDY